VTRRPINAEHEQRQRALVAEGRRQETMEAARQSIAQASGRVTDAIVKANDADCDDLDAVRSCIEAGLFLLDAIVARENGEDAKAVELVELATKMAREIAA